MDNVVTQLYMNLERELLHTTGRDRFIPSHIGRHLADELGPLYRLHLQVDDDPRITQ